MSILWGVGRTNVRRALRAHIRLARGEFVGEILGRGYEYEAKMTV